MTSRSISIKPIPNRARSIAPKAPKAVPQMSTIRDSRDDPPRDWDEVKLLQEALVPTFESFVRILDSHPPYVDVWWSYNHQYAKLQQTFENMWQARKWTGPPPALARRGRWIAGIRMFRIAKFEVALEDTERFTCPSLLGRRPCKNSLLAHEQQARRVKDETHESTFEEWLEEGNLGFVLIQVPDKFIRWLKSCGFSFFMQHQALEECTWEHWRDWIAPGKFQERLLWSQGIKLHALPDAYPLDHMTYPLACVKEITLEDAWRGNSLRKAMPKQPTLRASNREAFEQDWLGNARLIMSEAYNASRSHGWQFLGLQQ